MRHLAMEFVIYGTLGSYGMLAEQENALLICNHLSDLYDVVEALAEEVSPALREVVTRGILLVEASFAAATEL